MLLLNMMKWRYSLTKCRYLQSTNYCRDFSSFNCRIVIRIASRTCQLFLLLITTVYKQSNKQILVIYTFLVKYRDSISFLRQSARQYCTAIVCEISKVNHTLDTHLRFSMIINESCWKEFQVCHSSLRVKLLEHSVAF